MSAFLQFALAIALLIGAARLGGLLSKPGQPGVLGELLVGVLLGPSLLNFFTLLVHRRASGRADQASGRAGRDLLMFLAGLEIELDELPRPGGGAATGLLGVMAPVVLGAARRCCSIPSARGAVHRHRAERHW
jgi:Kef-type K+ transport system membrane component KefB